MSGSQFSRLATGNPSGTPPYMAPEVWEGKYGRASDIYAIGVLTYLLITGQLPFQGNVAALAHQHTATSVPPLDKYAPDLKYPPVLDGLISRAMAKNPSERYKSATDFADLFMQAITPTRGKGSQDESAANFKGEKLEERLARARKSLEGLAIGDAFGTTLLKQDPQFKRNNRLETLPPAPWESSDNLWVAASVYEVLRKFGEIDQAALSSSLTNHHSPQITYAPTIHNFIKRSLDGENWYEITGNVIQGQPSAGYGGALRAAMIGAYYFDDIDQVIMQTVNATTVTHAQHDGVAGSIAMALAAAWLCRLQGYKPTPSINQFIGLLLPNIPSGKIKGKLKIAQEIKGPVDEAARAWGIGQNQLAEDSVPLAIWCVASEPTNFESALWKIATVKGAALNVVGSLIGALGALTLGLQPFNQEWINRTTSIPPRALQDLGKDIPSQNREIEIGETVGKNNPTAVAIDLFKGKIQDYPIQGRSVADFYQKIFEFLATKNFVAELDMFIPFATSAKRFLVAYSPVHPNGNQFFQPVKHLNYYFEANRSRQVAVTDINKLLNKIHLEYRPDNT